MSNPNRTALINTTYKVLQEHYQPFQPPADRTLFEHLLYACCLENARPEAADEAYAKLQQTFYDWNEVRVTTVKELAETMSSLPDGTAAAKRLKHALQHIFETQYSFDIEYLKKQNLGKSIKDLEAIRGVTPFVADYVTQHGLGGHSIPLSNSIIDVLMVVGVVTEVEAKRNRVPGLERAIPKAKGIEFASLLHQLAAEFLLSPHSSKLRALLVQIDPEAKERLAKRLAKAEETPPPPPPPEAGPKRASSRSARPASPDSAPAAHGSRGPQAKASADARRSRSREDEGRIAVRRNAGGRSIQDFGHETAVQEEAPLMTPLLLVCALLAADASPPQTLRDEFDEPVTRLVPASPRRRRAGQGLRRRAVRPRPAVAAAARVPGGAAAFPAGVALPARSRVDPAQNRFPRSPASPLGRGRPLCPAGHRANGAQPGPVAAAGRPAVGSPRVAGLAGVVRGLLADGWTSSQPTRQTGRGPGRLAGLCGDRAARVADPRFCQVRRLFRPRARRPGATRTSGQERSRQAGSAGTGRPHVPVDGRGILSGRAVRRRGSHVPPGLPGAVRQGRTGAARLLPGTARRQTRPDRPSPAAPGKLLCHAILRRGRPALRTARRTDSAVPSRTRPRPTRDCDRAWKSCWKPIPETPPCCRTWPDSTCRHSDSSPPSSDTSNCWYCSRRRTSTRLSRISTASRTARTSWRNCAELRLPKGPP